MTDRVSRRSLLRLGVGAAGVSPLLAAADGIARGLPRFRRGVNAWPWFSFPLETPAPGADYAIWPPYVAARPVPSFRDLRMLAAAGFDFIRLPVNPAPFLFLATKGGERRFRQLVARLTEAVEQADAAGLGVILNLQPEGMPGYSPEDLYGAGATAVRFAAYVALVATLAEALGALSVARLAFEPVNEPSQRVAQAADWAAKQVTLLAAARSRAPNLTLVATGAVGGMIGGLVLLDPKPLVAALDPLLLTFHFYEPYLFSHQGAPWLARAEPLYRWLNAVPWPGSAGSMETTMAAVRARMSADPAGASPATLDQAADAIRRQLKPYFEPPIDRGYFAGGAGNPFFDALAAWMRQHGIGAERVFLGEFGALRTTDVVSPVTGGPYLAAGPADRARYLHDVRATAEAHGFGWALWTLFNPGMGIMDETTRRLDPAMIEALGLTMP